MRFAIYFKIPDEQAAAWPGSVCFTTGPRRPHIPIIELDLSDEAGQTEQDLRTALDHVAQEIKPFAVALAPQEGQGPISLLSAAGTQLGFNIEVIQTTLMRLGFSGMLQPPGEAIPVTWGYSQPPPELNCTISEIGLARL